MGPEGSWPRSIPVSLYYAKGINSHKGWGRKAHGPEVFQYSLYYD